MKIIQISIFVMTTYFALHCNGLRAQDSVLVVPGTRVRVSSSKFLQRIGQGNITNRIKSRYAGRVVSLKADTMQIKADDCSEPLIVPLTHVKKLEVSRGRKGRTGKGAVIGTLVGVGLGGIIGAFALPEG